jgi:hypothetical protein
MVHRFADWISVALQHLVSGFGGRVSSLLVLSADCGPHGAAARLDPIEALRAGVESADYTDGRHGHKKAQNAQKQIRQH